MSGHSKWNNIKRKKENTDGAKAKIFTKCGREISVAVKEGGPDPASNSKLRDAIANAKANNVPNDNIERVIKKAMGEGKDTYEEILYEGYGPGGTAFLVETLSDNRNRTAANIRHYFDKFGGNLGQSGCVSFLFTQKGVIDLNADGVDEEAFMEDALEAGVEDYTFEDGVIECTVAPEGFSAAREYFDKKGFVFYSAEVAYLPSTTTHLDDPDQIKKIGLLIDHLEEDDDVQDIWHNWDEEDGE